MGMMQEGSDRLELRDVGKTFVMHLRGGAALPVVSGVSFAVRPGECVALGGPSGIGKSSILKMIFGNYRADSGQILLRDGDRVVDIARAEPREVLDLRRRQVGYVSQFLRVIPRVSARDIVAAAARETGLSESEAGARAEALMTQLNIPERLWHLPPATFSGGEQQRVNIARGFAAERPLLLLDEPTAALDAANRAVVVALIEAAKARGVSLLGIFHDDAVRAAVADRTVDVQRFAAGVAA
jgi:alpha-D-ribose 1-methylphosphonate 5-triphosphate synthase subunit PhnL